VPAHENVSGIDLSGRRGAVPARVAEVIERPSFGAARAGTQWHPRIHHPNRGPASGRGRGKNASLASARGKRGSAGYDTGAEAPHQPRKDSHNREAPPQPFPTVRAIAVKKKAPENPGGEGDSGPVPVPVVGVCLGQNMPRHRFRGSPPPRRTSLVCTSPAFRGWYRFQNIETNPGTPTREQNRGAGPCAFGNRRGKGFDGSGRFYFYARIG